MKYLLNIFLSFFFVSAYAMQKKEHFLLLHGWGKLLNDSLHNPQVAEQFKKDLHRLSLSEITTHETTYIKIQNTLKTLQFSNIPLTLWRPILNARKWCSQVLPIIQAIKNEKAKMHNYLLWGIGIVGICIACCTFCSLIDHTQETEKQFPTINLTIDYNKTRAHSSMPIIPC